MGHPRFSDHPCSAAVSFRVLPDRALGEFADGRAGVP